MWLEIIVGLFVFDSTSLLEHGDWVTCLVLRWVARAVDGWTSRGTRLPTTCASRTSWRACSTTTPSHVWRRTARCSTTSSSRRRTSRRTRWTVTRRRACLDRAARRRRRCIGTLVLPRGTPTSSVITTPRQLMTPPQRGARLRPRRSTRHTQSAKWSFVRVEILRQSKPQILHSEEGSWCELPAASDHCGKQPVEPQVSGLKTTQYIHTEHGRACVELLQTSRSDDGLGYNDWTAAHWTCQNCYQCLSLVKCYVADRIHLTVFY